MFGVTLSSEPHSSSSSTLSNRSSSRSPSPPPLDLSFVAQQLRESSVTQRTGAVGSTGRFRSLSEPPPVYSSLTDSTFSPPASSAPSEASSSYSNGAGPSVSLVSAGQPAFTQYCCELLARVRETRKQAKMSSPVTPRGTTKKGIRGLLKAGSKDAVELSFAVDPIRTTDEMKSICRTLLEFGRHGFNRFPEVVLGESTRTWTLSRLVEDILPLSICKEAIGADPEFAKEMGTLRFEAVEGARAIADIGRISQMFESTISSRVLLTGFLEHESAKRFKAVINEMGNDLRTFHISDAVVHRFFHKAGLKDRLQGVPIGVQRNYLPLIIQSPYRAIYESNQYIVTIPDTLHSDVLDLEHERSVLEDMQQDPLGCLDGTRWQNLLSHQMKVGKCKERTLAAIKEMIVRSTSLLRHKKVITEESRKGVLEQLRHALPSADRGPNWEGLAALINAIALKHGKHLNR